MRKVSSIVMQSSFLDQTITKRRDVRINGSCLISQILTSETQRTIGLPRVITIKTSPNSLNTDFENFQSLTRIRRCGFGAS